jgi:hypothetical protein
LRACEDDAFFAQRAPFDEKGEEMGKPALLGLLLSALCALSLVPAVQAQKATEKAPGSAAAAVPAAISTGDFVGLAHKTSGKVEVYKTPDGGHVLRLENFKTSNGPDVRVYLVKGTDAKNNENIKAGNFVDLGPLKGNIGDQNYTIPKDVDLDQYQSVSIWCRRFSVNFAAASLEPAQGASGTSR